MALFKGGALRLLQTLLYALAFCASAIVLGIYSYYLAVLADRNLPIATRWKAVEGLSGAAVLYTIATTLLTCCLAGITFLSLLGLFLDLCFVGAFIAIAILTRHGANSCSGNVSTPLGSGPANSNADGYGANGFGFGSNENSTYAPDLRLACKLNSAAFGASIAAIVFFLITALMQLALIRHHKKEKRYGPSPANNYTSGTGSRRGMFGRKPKTTSDGAEMGVAGAGAGYAAGSTIRPSHDTETTFVGNTANGTNPTVIQKEGLTHDGHAPHVGYNPHDTTHSHGGYYTSPVGTQNPYGYDNTTSTTVPATGVARDF